MQSTTGTTIKTYLNWMIEEIEKKEFGEVAITFVIHEGQVVRVKKESSDSEKITS